MVHQWYDKDIRKPDKIRDTLESRYISDRISVARVSPSGRLTAGYVPAPKTLKSDARYEAERGLYVPWESSMWCAWEGLVVRHGLREERAPILGSSAAPNHHEAPRRRYGLKGISQNGRNKVYEGSKMLDERYKGRLGFYTLTCPYNSPSEVYEFNRNIGEIVRRYFQRLKRYYDGLSIPFSYVSVLEIQEKRFIRTGTPVLHIHYVAPCYRPGSYSWILDSHSIRAMWGATLQECVGGNPSCESSVDAQVVKSSASGYLAKYLSKGSGESEFLADIAPCQLPKQWWSMSANVRAAIKNATIELPSCIAEWYLGGNGRGGGGIFELKYYKDIYIDWKGLELRVGMIGQLSTVALMSFRDEGRYLEILGTL